MLFIFSQFPTTNSLQLVDKDLRMPALLERQTANAGLAYPLDEPLAQDPLSPRKGTASLEPTTRLRAITILRDHPEDDIFSYLKFTRCHSQLSHDQYLAVCALKGCSDTEIRAWFKQARKLCGTPAYFLNYKS